ncbi:hypothetical protein PAMC26510_35350 [Caballeronia sordidicola]|uniref:Uncharacterized protein n=1 Tax=Caballeronia sordidicola TaxID=196367 RepID=A0A242M4Y1_CABSO|nr:hypothetical protein PAMC26510_35350 [Caballeronia sordidicola]
MKVFCFLNDSKLPRIETAYALARGSSAPLDVAQCDPPT